MYRKSIGLHSVGYVVDCSEFAVTLWKGVPKVHKGQKFLDPLIADGKVKWEYAFVNKDLKDWYVQDTEALPPS